MKGYALGFGANSLDAKPSEVGLGRGLTGQALQNIEEEAVDPHVQDHKLLISSQLVSPTSNQQTP